ncbi:MAG: hypothetical protein A2Y77_06540 [Planctomycetes bacterium RBG_13_62_9]|nr:MAG: hypothetical protein A2Y77_06540 [Planctomycetes bacterium RBG_13_62_9]
MASVVLVLLNIYQFGHMGLTSFVWISIVAVPVVAILCSALSRRRACRTTDTQQTQIATA